MNINELKELREAYANTRGVAEAIDELIELKGDQVPVAVVEHSDYIITAEIRGDIPRRKAVRELYEGALVIGQELFTAPQKPVVRFTPPINPVMFNADVMFGYNKARAEDKAAIEAAGGTVKDGE